MQMKAVWNGAVLAESDQIIIVENNRYFPSESLNRSYIKESKTQTVCPWKGTASYYSLVVNGEINRDAAWYYPEPKEAVKQIKNHVAFWKGVQIIE